MRKSLEETWRHLESLGDVLTRHPDGRPAIPNQMPSYDDDVLLGIHYFKSGLSDADYSHLTIPRMFCGRSGFEGVQFVGTDLSESRMCWNDFEECDFTEADLSGCDMRASKFTGCKFIGASLRGADLRGSSFEDCEFDGADVRGAIADKEIANEYLADKLTAEQHASMTWHDTRGEEAPGG